MSDRHEMTTRQKAEFARIASALNALMADVRGTHSNAGYYLACDTLHVMSGPSHEGHGVAHPERSMARAKIKYADGGDW